MRAEDAEALTDSRMGSQGLPQWEEYENNSESVPPALLTYIKEGGKTNQAQKSASVCLGIVRNIAKKHFASVPISTSVSVMATDLQRKFIF